MHTFGGQVGHDIRKARQKVAAMIHAEPEEIVFTSCGTESDNTAIVSAINSVPQKKHIITTRVEHPAVKNMAEYLTKKGIRATFVPVDRQGQLDLDYFADSLTDDTAVVSVMWANNETGVIFPIQEIADILKGKDVIFHTDAVQAIGKVPVDVKKINVDMLSLSGHKIHAPKGVGALYIRRGTRFSPFMVGGHQEAGRRGGTENVASIVGLGKACELAMNHLEDENIHVKKRRDRLEAEILKYIPRSLVNGDINNRLPGTTNISFEYVEGEAILLMLNEHGICASSGSACTSGSLEPSHVMGAMGVDIVLAHSSTRFSLGPNNTEKEIDFILQELPAIVQRLREMSPLYNRTSPAPLSCDECRMVSCSH